MFQTITLKNITFNQSLEKVVLTKKAIGWVEKIVVKYKEGTSPSFILRMFTSDGELLLSVEGCENAVYYPRNWNVANQKYVGLNIAPEGSGAFNAEKYLSTGNLIIQAIATSENDGVAFLKIVVRGEVRDEFNINEEEALNIVKSFEKVEKANGVVTSNTTGVYNARHGRKRTVSNALKLLAVKTLREIQREEGIVKKFVFKQEEFEDLESFIEEALFDKSFEGVGKTVSERIKEYIVRALLKGYPLTRIINYIYRKGGRAIDKARAETIARTEVQAIQNKVREWSYKKLDPEGRFKYKWIGPDDERTTEICRRIKERTKHGVSLEELKRIIYEEGKKAGFEPRDFTPHINCRHTFVRVYG